MKIIAGEAYLGHVSVFHRYAEAVAELPFLVRPPGVDHPVVSAHAEEKVIHRQPFLP